MRRASLPALLVGLVLAGCASGPAERATPIRAENLFLSPSGEPFRGGRDEPYASAKWFAQADADHDGVLTPAEFTADAERAFRRYDTNGDGVIDGIETAAYEDKVAPEILPRIANLSAGEGMDTTLFGGRGRQGGERGARGRPRPARAGDRAQQGAGLFGLLDEPEPVTAADADLDGRITLAEWRRRTERRFALIVDGAASLTLATLPKTTMQILWERRKADDLRSPDRERRGPPPPP